MRARMKMMNERVVCKDGFTFSCQASETNYCSPRVDRAERYIEVEIGFPDGVEPLIMPYCEDSENPTETVYGHVPSDLVRHIIDKHGGIASGEVPKGVPVYGKTHYNRQLYDEDNSA
tara:strand:+ start:570 stop:920 length:351 start_codon:yes stop_codon:yes gene_type:complete